MKRPVFITLFCAVAAAAYGNAAGKEADCSVARDPRRCAALEDVRKACGDLQGQARTACIREAMPAPDCSRAPDTAQCQERRSAMAACKEKRGKAKRLCIHRQLGAAGKK